MWVNCLYTRFFYKHPLYKHPRLKNREKSSIYVVNDVIVTEARLKSDMLIKKSSVVDYDQNPHCTLAQSTTTQ